MPRSRKTKHTGPVGRALGPFARCFRWFGNRPFGAFGAGRLRGLVLGLPAFGLMTGAAKLVGHPVASLSAWQFMLLLALPAMAAVLVLWGVVDQAIRRLDRDDRPSATDWMIMVGTPVLGLIAIMAFMR